MFATVALVQAARPQHRGQHASVGDTINVEPVGQRLDALHKACEVVLAIRVGERGLTGRSHGHDRDSLALPQPAHHIRTPCHQTLPSGRTEVIGKALLGRIGDEQGARPQCQTQQLFTGSAVGQPGKRAPRHFRADVP